MIGIIDYGSGNLASVQNALEHLGHDACICEDPNMLQEFDRIILPGVGSFKKGIDYLKNSGLFDFIKFLLHVWKFLVFRRLDCYRVGVG